MAQISASFLNNKWMPKAKIMFPSSSTHATQCQCQWQSCLDQAQLSPEIRDESPHMLYSQGSCKCQPSRWYFERQSVWFGVWVFFFFSQTHSRQQLMKFYHGNKLFVLLGNMTEQRKRNERERELALWFCRFLY